MRDLGGNQLMYALQDLESRLRVDVGLYEAYRVFYWTEETDAIRQFPGIEPLLTAIRRAGLRTGVVTQKRRNFDIQGRSAGAMSELRQAGLSEAFSAVIGMEDVTRFKPHPEGIRLAMRVLGATPEHTLMIGDSFPDMEAGRGRRLLDLPRDLGIATWRRRPRRSQAGCRCRYPGRVADPDLRAARQLAAGTPPAPGA